MIRSSTLRASADPRPTAQWSPELRGYYETLLRHLRWPSSDSANTFQCVGIISSQSGEGVSTVARHLAVAAASLTSQRVLLVDAVFNPQPSRESKSPGKAGLAEAIFEEVPVMDLVEGTELPTLFRLPAGDTPVALRDWTKYESFAAEFLGQMKAHFDLAIFDLPLVHGAGAFSFPLSSLDGVLLVVEAERHAPPTLRETKRLLDSASANVLGAVLNKQRRYGPRWLHD